ncbi:MAG: mechanosensitive ion channel domain-containing protein [Rhodanobacteraceae bacterium]
MHELLQRLDLPNLPAQAIHFGLRLAAALILLLIGFWLIARIANLFRRALERGHLDVTLTGFLRNVIYGILIALLLVAALEFVGLPSASLITALGAAGLAIGLALQGSLSNLAWGVLLILFRPFRVGDFVQFGSIMGTVERVDLMQTYLVMPDNREAIVPNAKVGSDAIINFNRRGTRRFEITIGIGYGDDIGRAMDVVRELFAADPRILKKPAPGVWVESLGDSSVNLVIRAWVNVSDLWETQNAFTRSVKERFDAEGISIPFPQHEVTVRQMTDVAGGKP